MPKKCSHTTDYAQNGPPYDMARDLCHVCGCVCQMDYPTGLRTCVNKFCQVEGVRFSIPFKRGVKLDG